MMSEFLMKRKSVNGVSPSIFLSALGIATKNITKPRVMRESGRACLNPSLSWNQRTEGMTNDRMMKKGRNTSLNPTHRDISDVDSRKWANLFFVALKYACTDTYVGRMKMHG